MAHEYLAHTENSEGKVQLLGTHLQKVGELAAKFAERFGGSDEARTAGLLHDLGKFRDAFQSYLRKERTGGVDTHHAIYGAAGAYKRGWPCYLAIGGHHAGLHDRYKLGGLIEKETVYKISDELPSLEAAFRQTVGPIPEHLTFPSFLEQECSPFSLELYIRMLFSCLVDADRLDTEAHCKGQSRDTIRLVDMVEALLDHIMSERESKSREGIVNEIRHTIFEQCITKANRPQGFFSLTVPTGGGKTLAGMAFALAHARKWNLDRVIVVIPYLSIIEQNAKTYRQVLDPKNQGIVVEHHSAVPVPDDKEPAESNVMDWAAENWDAPVIVTTSVQFVETLFARSPTKSRKLHNVARSVVILDEVQTLPFHLLNPLLNIVKELKRNYGATFLFMTATQPAFRRNSLFLSEGFEQDEVLEITEETSRVFAILKRVDYVREGTIDWPELASQMAHSAQVLTVVNVRKHAFELWEALSHAVAVGNKNFVFHLSSAMCPEHRSTVLGEVKNPHERTIRHCLQNGLPCRVVATQVVEAGVDLDFPLVFRAMGPLDSIVQAAGRCNREGKLVDSRNRHVPGRVVIFTPPNHSLPRGIYMTATQHTAGFIDRVSLDRLAKEPQHFGDYFSQLFQLADTDHAKGKEASIQEDREHLRFQEVSRKGKVIDNDGTPVVVPYARGKELIHGIRDRSSKSLRTQFDYRDLRSLQRFMVNVRDYDFKLLWNLGVVTPLLRNLNVFVLNEGCYSKNLGILIENRPMEDFIQ